jgi:hypothetical protein
MRPGATTEVHFGVRHRNLFDGRPQRGLLRFWLLRGGGSAAAVGFLLGVARAASNNDWTVLVVAPALAALVVCCFIVMIRVFVHGDPIRLRHDW